MSRWRRFLALSPGDRALIAEAAALQSAVRLGIAILPYQMLQRLLARSATRGNRPGPRTAGAPVERIVWAISAAARRLPFSTTCLVQALAGRTMLERRGHAAEVRFGVRSAEAGASRVEAHAWLAGSGVVILGGLEDKCEYLEMSQPDRP